MQAGVDQLCLSPCPSDLHRSIDSDNAGRFGRIDADEESSRANNDISTKWNEDRRRLAAATGALLGPPASFDVN